MKKTLICFVLLLSVSLAFCTETARRDALSINLGQTLSGALLWHEKTFIVPIDYEHAFSNYVIADLTVAPRYAKHFDVGLSLGAKLLLPAPWDDLPQDGQRFRGYVGLFPIYDFRPVKTLSGERGILNCMISLGFRDRLPNRFFTDGSAGIDFTNVELLGEGFQPFFLILNLSIGFYF